jgi:hypothetical protein
MTELALIASDPSALDKAADPAAFVIQACERAKSWLAEVLEHGDIEQIVELKSQAEAIRIYTMSKQLGKDAELSAAEIVRRAERGIGMAIRRGQEAGTINTRKDGGRKPPATLDTPVIKNKVDEFMPRGKTAVQTYAMVDGVNEQQFENAIKEARAEGSLSRVNVIRKLRDDVPNENPKRAYKRQPIADAAKESGWKLRKEVEKLERLFADDRFRENKDKVATHLHGHLTYALSTLPKLLERINPQGE